MQVEKHSLKLSPKQLQPIRWVVSNCQNHYVENLAPWLVDFGGGQKNEKRKIPWIAWDKLCKSKVEGGMGFRDLKVFNLALLAKQGWRLMQNQNSLFHQVFNAKYFANDTFLDA